MSRRLNRYKKLAEGNDMNLIPMMNLIALLIPTLMISTEYLKIATIAVSSPQVGPKNTAPADPNNEEKEKPLQLTLGVTSIGFYLKCNVDACKPPEGVAATGGQGADIGKVPVDVYNTREESGITREVLRIWKGADGKKYMLGVKEVDDEKIDDALKSYRESGNLISSKAQDFDYPALHKRLREIYKQATEQNKPDKSQIILTPEPKIPFHNLIRIMDASRSYVEVEGDAPKKKLMFPQVVLSAGVV